MNSKNILITGASGLIGNTLTKLLLSNGHQVKHLSRSAHHSNAIKTFVWDIAKGYLDTQALNGTDTIIHLAGAGVADERWTEARKREILESRIKSTELLYQTLKKGGHTITSFISASAIGYYGFEDNDTLQMETSPSGKDFLADVVRQWEEAVDKIATLGIRVVKVRIGIVLSAEGGALREMMKPIKYFVGSPLGTGKQNVSWIHIDDVCAVFLKAAEDNSWQGSYNATGPYAVTNKELTKVIAKALHRPLILPNIPAFVLKLIVGEMADVVLNGSNVSSGKIQQHGFTFRYPTLEAAIQHLLKEK